MMLPATVNPAKVTATPPLPILQGWNLPLYWLPGSAEMPRMVRPQPSQGRRRCSPVAAALVDPVGQHAQGAERALIADTGSVLLISRSPSSDPGPELGWDSLTSRLRR